jgi:hypothetical protein
MKTRITIFKFALLFALLFTSVISISQEGVKLITKKKTIVKTFDTGEVKSLMIDNRFGDINISKWKSNAIELQITIEVIGWEEDDVILFLEKIIPLPEATEGEEGSTIVSTYNSKFIRGCGCLSEKQVYRRWFEKNITVKNYRIDYEIKIPENMSSIVLINSYGNISIPSFSGHLKINLRNGNLRTGNLDLTRLNYYDISVYYGKVNLGEVTNGSLMFYSCDLVKIGALCNSKINSSFSNFRLGYTSGVGLKSKSDDYLIESVDSLGGTGQFTTISINNFGSYLKFNNRSGEITIKKIKPNFNSILLEGYYNHYALPVAELNYLLSAEFESTELNCPENIISRSFQDKAMNSRITFNKKIGSKVGYSRITLKCSKCNIDLLSD